jgi:hypothetical protein
MHDEIEEQLVEPESEEESNPDVEFDVWSSDVNFGCVEWRREVGWVLGFLKEEDLKTFMLWGRGKVVTDDVSRGKNMKHSEKKMTLIGTSTVVVVPDMRCASCMWGMNMSTFLPRMPSVSSSSSSTSAKIILEGVERAISSEFRLISDELMNDSQLIFETNRKVL